jgi:hypothetical protein
MKKLFTLLAVVFITGSSAWAQNGVEMADVMRSNGKIYVVVAVAALVMLGILSYLVVLDRKVSRLEKDIKNISDN